MKGHRPMPPPIGDPRLRPRGTSLTVLTVHGDEADDSGLRLPRGVPVTHTDDPDDRSVLPPGERFADQPNLSRFWSG